VSVLYRSSGPQGGEVRMSWLAADGTMRVDMAEGRYLLVDRRAGRAFMVSEAERAVLELPAGGAATPGGGGPRPYSPDARFAREGSDRVAGTPCTVWRVED
jgi:hypothetical protein